MQFSSLSAYAADAVRIFSSPTWDFILLLALAGGGLFWAFMAGRRKIVSTIMLTYVALAVFPTLPVKRILGFIRLDDRIYGVAVLFLVFFVLLVWLLGARRGRPFSPGGPWWQVLVLSFVQVGLFIHVILSFFPKEQVNLLSPLIRRIFADSDLRVWWLAAPLGLLIIIRRLAMRDE